MNSILRPSMLSRRDFLATSAGSLASLIAAGHASAATAPTGETLVQQLHGSLTEEQRKVICFDFDHALRSKVDNNWHIVKTPIGQIFKEDQVDLVRQIFSSLHSDEYRSEVLRQFNEDTGKGDKGFETASVALFGTPGSGKFEFVFTGRHCTRRCDGDSVAGSAFGGPIFYGHASKGFNEGPSHDGNVYWYQAKRANEVFQALDGKQREMSLLGASPEEKGNDTVKLTGKTKGLPGIPMTELSADQKGLVKLVLGDLLKPFRKTDADEAMKMIEAGGFDNLHLSFYKNSDLGKDNVWDDWQIEGPNVVWYFRGAPHVHCWAHIKAPA